MSATTLHRIDGKKVTKAEFERLFATLKESGGWFCAETTTGGETGWEAVDPNGAKYQYTAVTDGDRNTQDLRRLAGGS